MGSSESSLPMDEGEATSNSTNQGEFVHDPEDPWWWEIENQNLLLDVVSDEVDISPRASTSTSAVAVSRNQFTNMPSEDREQKVIKANRRSKSKTPECSARESEGVSESLVLQKSAEIEASVRKEQSLEEFKEELKAKRMARQTAVNDLREEIQSLRRQLAEERDAARRLRNGALTPAERSEEGDNVPSVSEELRKKLLEESDRVLAQQISDDEVVAESTNPKVHLAEAQLALQLANADNLSLTTELGVTRKQVVSLKEVVACCKQMISMKEEQVNQLKGKLTEIESSLAERELRLMSDNLRQEYDRQLANMRTLRQLYEERARVAAAERENLERQVAIKKDEVEREKEKTRKAEEFSAALEKRMDSVNDEMQCVKEQCNEYRFENKTLKEEMGAVNKLFSQMLMGFNGTNNLDIDRLTTMLEENRTLLNDMATKEANFDGATLPKLLFELVQQASVANLQPAIQHTKSFPSASNPAEGVPENDNDDDGDSRDITRRSRRTNVTTTATVAPETSYLPTGIVDNDVDVDVDVDVDAEVAASATSTPLFTSPTVCGLPTIEADTSFDGNAEQASSNSCSATTTTTINTTTTNRTTMTAESLHGYIPHPGSRQNPKQQQENLDHNQTEVMAKVASAEEIIGNLPKVWKVLMELLSHHKIERVQFKENGQSEDCFKSVETPNGPKAELSVSKTYIKLKDLILEKKSLVKETTRLKTLNCHLEYRLNEQEKRLSAVSLELQKTWHLVGKMQRQHRQLHTQEQILRYQLQQKRRLLSELKDELEYCRRKWATARAKNDESQLQCDDLRREFAKRKLQDVHNSAESGYSDGLGSDEDDITAAAAKLSKNWADVFEVKKTIQRMQSTSPLRSGLQSDEELRWSSAPPSVVWPTDDSLLLMNDEPSTSSGALPKKGPRKSRSKIRGSSKERDEDEENEESPDGQQSDRATRIQRLEEQCKSLIAAVIETSDNREKLEIQLCRFQDEIAPAQYAIPLEDYIANKTRERMTRASSAPEFNANKSDESGLTSREEEYTRKRSERLGRLEEESRQLMSRIKRTSDKGNSLRSSFERIHSKRALSREGSFESNTEEVSAPEDSEETPQGAVGTVNTTEEEDTKLLTEKEEEYTSKRAERLKRLEEESKLLLSKLSKNSERGTTFNSKLDALHEKYGSEERDNSTEKTNQTIEERLENVAKMSTNREERLKILEEEGSKLLSKLSNTSDRGSKMIDHLSEREHNRNLKASLEQAKDNTSEVVAGPILPTPANVACSSIVSEEITERVVITRTPSQIAQSQGAVPKAVKPQFTQPMERESPKPQSTVKLCAATGPKRIATSKRDPESETLEEMVRRLRNLPFPSETATTKGNDDDETASHSKA